MIEYTRSRDLSSKVKKLVSFAKAYENQTKQAKVLKLEMQACHHVVLQCFTIGHFKSRDSRSKVKNLSFLQKFIKTKSKQLVTLNFQGKHVIM